MATDLTNLLEAVEEARAKESPHVPAGILQAILRLEADHMENRVAARQGIQVLVGEYSSAQGASDAAR